MSVLCKCCKKTTYNNAFGLKTNGSQYETRMKCRDKKLK